MLETISSSKPRMDSICVSIQWVMMGMFTLDSFTFWEKEGGNLVVRRSLFWALDEIMEAVPFMDGISMFGLVNQFVFLSMISLIGDNNSFGFVVVDTADTVDVGLLVDAC